MQSGGLQPGGLRPGDVVTEAQLQALIGEGRSPLTGVQLGRAYQRCRGVRERAAARVAALDRGMGDVDRAAAVQRIEAEERDRGARRAVAGYDFTFSVPKSVSVLWGVADAGLQELIVRAHHQAVGEVLGFMEREVVVTRVAGSTRDGPVAQAPVEGVLAAVFDHWDSRAGDPQLHTHCVLANRVRTVADGLWRAVDGRPVFAATVALSELYNAVLADQLSRVVGVEWEARDRGRDRSPAWEIRGVGEELVREFSSRSADIEEETARLAARYRAEHGREPSRRTVIRLRQQATLATRQDKQLRSLAESTQEWRRRAAGILGADAALWAGSVAGAEEPLLLRADDIPLDVVEALGREVMGRVGEKRSTWTRWNLHAEATRQAMGWRFASMADRELVTDMIVDAAQAASTRLTPDELPVPAAFRNQDGSSRLRPRHLALYSSQGLLDAEARLLALAQRTGGPALGPDAVGAARALPGGSGTSLSESQADAVASVAGSGRVVDVLVGPAGAGKTTALGALRFAWEAERGPGSVVGLAPSAAAAAVLAEDLGIATENTAKWLADHDHRGARFHAGQLVIVDEASLAGTFTLDRLAALAAAAGAKLLLVGDWAQLQAVDAGGAFNLLVADRAQDAPELGDVHRFRAEWEKTASLALRCGRPAAIGAYQARGRVVGGDLADMVEAAYTAWRDDVEQGLASVLVADSRDTVRELNQRARDDRITAGQVNLGRAVALENGSHASKGDVVITRRNNRHLVAGRTGWVRNGDRWTVARVHDDGAVTVRRAGMSSGGTVTLPAAYASEHLDLGYAVTAHRAQGVTTNTAHTVVAPTTTRENLYVAMTRGRDSNRAYVALDRPDDAHGVPHPADNPDATPRSVLEGVLRNSGAELSARQAVNLEDERWNNITQLGAEYELLAAAATRDRWANLVRTGLPAGTAERALRSDAFGPLAAALGRAEEAGWDPDAEFPRLAAGSLAGADDPASVLHRRLTLVADRLEARPTRRAAARLLGMFPEVTGPVSPAMREALDQRSTALKARAAEMLRRAAASREPWLAALGPRPRDQRLARRWDRAALAAAAYRDRYEVTGPEPLGVPATVAQIRDAAKVRALIEQTRPAPAPTTAVLSPTARRHQEGPAI